MHAVENSDCHVVTQAGNAELNGAAQVLRHLWHNDYQVGMC